MKEKWLMMMVLLSGVICSAEGADLSTNGISSVRVDSKTYLYHSNDLASVKGDEAIVRENLKKKIDDLVLHTNFSGLDALAADLRKSKARIAEGTWHLLTFYRLLTYEWLDVPDVTETQWQARLSFLNAWTNTNPTSITARVALARFYKNYAWNARGLGTESTVTPEGWRYFGIRLRYARKILIGAQELKAKCPVWWDTMQYVALGEGWSRANYDSLFEQAIAFEPDYIFFYNNKVMYLLPRWYGEEGDWQLFALQAAANLDGEAGDILYAQIGWRVHERHFYDGFLRDSKISFSKMKRGLEALLKQYPDSLSAPSEMAYLAYQRGDWIDGAPWFARISTNVDSSVWVDGFGRFLRARASMLSASLHNQ